MDDFENWAATIPWMDNPPLYSMFFDLRCRRDDEIKNAFIKGLRLKPEEGLKILTRRKNEYIKEMKGFCSKFTRPTKDKLFSCGVGCGGCLDAYGYFQPCAVLKHPACVYNLKNGSLKDALTNSFPKLRKIKVNNPEYLKRCAKCFLKGLCEQCPAKSWMEYGSLDTPVEYLCDIAHAQAKFLGLLGAKEKAWEVRDWEERIRNFTKEEVNNHGSKSKH
jgi:radical SAM protein with 4Fe4S-binding SPASM domain